MKMFFADNEQAFERPKKRLKAALFDFKFLSLKFAGIILKISLPFSEKEFLAPPA
jgi:hypothetical protein